MLSNNSPTCQRCLHRRRCHHSDRCYRRPLLPLVSGPLVAFPVEFSSFRRVRDSAAQSCPCGSCRSPYHHHPRRLPGLGLAIRGAGVLHFVLLAYNIRTKRSPLLEWVGSKCASGGRSCVCWGTRRRLTSPPHGSQVYSGRSH